MRKVNKAQARKLYNAGTTIAIIGHKIRNNTPWNIEIHINVDDYILGIISGTTDFNTRVATYENYNCNCSYETGYYCEFYALS